MAETDAIMAAPMVVADAGSEPGAMDMSAAMDLLEQHGITQENYADICAAAEMVFGEEPGEAMEAGDEQAMLDHAYGPGRQR